ncbi:hypothetical protein [Flavobacterium sp.]|uniref:hypothetical protein n=1 Tax=Flavobacterium sp. TaxID=239 RepID=UPI0031DCD20F
MRNKFKIIWLFISSYLLTLFLTSCNFFIENGGLGVSLDILESKKKGVFIQEYKSIPNPIKVHDTLNVNIKSAWLEHTWRYDGAQGQKAKKTNQKKYQIIITTDDRSLRGYNETWIIGNGNDSTFYHGYKNNIVMQLTNFSAQDTLNLKIIKGRNLAKPLNIIGRFHLIKI